MDHHRGSERRRTCLLNKGKIKVQALGKLKEILQQNAPSGKGIKNLGEGAFEVNIEDAVLDNIILKPKDMGALRLSFISNDADHIAKGFAINVTQIASKDGTDHIIGGQTFVFGQVQGFGTSPAPAKGIDLLWHWWYWTLPILLFLPIAYFYFRQKLRER